MIFNPLGAPSDLEVGDVVEHSLFRNGVIVSLRGTGELAEATIRFESLYAGTRNFRLAYANLTKVDSKLQVARSSLFSDYSNPDTKDTIQMLKELVTTIQEKCAIPHSDYCDFQIRSDISKPDVIAYTKRYGFKHLQELRSALREVLIGTGNAAQRLHSVDVLDIGCGPGLSRPILLEFGFSVKTYSGLDHAENFLWLARELNSDLSSCFLTSIDGQFVRSLGEIEPSRELGFVIMNHVANQLFVNESVLMSWAKNLKRIYPNGFNILSIEPRLAGFKTQQNLWMSELQDAGVKVLESLFTTCKGEFKASKEVSFLLCGKK